MNSNLIIKLLNLQQNMWKYFDRKRLKKKTHWNIYSEMMCIFNRILSAVFNQTQRIIFELIYVLIDWETVETVSDFIFWAPKSLQMVIAAMKLKDAYSLEEELQPT